MGDLLFYDAAYPPNPEPSGFDGVAFYIGGDTPHVWTLAEIDAQYARFRLPIYVRDNPQQANVTADVMEAVSRLGVIGAPKGCLVALDSETSVDINYVAQFYYQLRNEGYNLIDYGSVSSVFGNHIPDGYYWGAHWTDRPGVEQGQEMTQFKSLDAYDESTALATLPFWDTGAKDAPPIQPSPQEVTVQLPLLRQGAKGSAVASVQVLCGRLGHFPANSGTPESPDRDFGPATHDAVVAVQRSAGIADDGIVGTDTWTVLVTH